MQTLKPQPWEIHLNHTTVYSYRTEGDVGSMVHSIEGTRQITDTDYIIIGVGDINTLIKGTFMLTRQRIPQIQCLHSLLIVLCKKAKDTNSRMLI